MVRTYEGTLYNCLLTYNIASNSISFYGLGGGAYLASLYHCTVVSNSATGGGGGIYGGMPYNSIIFFNTATIGGQNWTNNPLTSFSSGVLLHHAEIRLLYSSGHYQRYDVCECRRW